VGIHDFGDGVRIVSQRDQHVNYDEALARLNQFPHLATVINAKWLEHQMKKEVEQYSLITGWLTTSPDDWNWAFRKNTQALENALAFLRHRVPEPIWEKLSKKISAPSDRAESKGTLAELSLAVFLVTHGISFNMEFQLNPPTDVDFVVKFADTEAVHIEMQSLAESVKSQKISRSSADHGGFPVIPDFKSEERRVIGKIFDKTPKFIEQSITLVALDCTAIPEHGNPAHGTIRDALQQVFGEDTRDLSGSEKMIRRLVDAVIWFQLDLDDALKPIERGYFLNEHSLYRNDQSLLHWISVWSAS